MQNIQDPRSIEPKASGMYLRTLTIKNFRSCGRTTVKLRPEMTLIVGENNSGKSNIIDAIQLATGPLSGKRYRYFDIDDYCDFADGDPIEINTEFDGVTALQRGHFLTALDIATNRVHYTVRHVPDEQVAPRLRTTYLAGFEAGADAEPENRARINHVYLPPLRDARKALDSAAGNRLAEIVRHITTKDEQESFVNAANTGLSKAADHSVVQTTTGKLQEHLGRLTNPVRGQNIELSFEALKLHRLIRNLRIKMAERGIDPADLIQSGLGYANLLYIATVILELQHAPDSELTIFLVEEPEAHLHPQLQAVLLDYLCEQAQLSVRDDASRPVGRIQVVATTHSPNLASSVGTANVVALRPHSTGNSSVVSKGTAALALADIPLTLDERRKIDQYLDVTRSELLFGRRAILVEGLAEAVLLPALAQASVFDSTDSTDITRLRALRAVSIISVGSVDFAPYIKLLAQQVDGTRLVDKLAIITDGDPILEEVDYDGPQEINGLTTDTPDGQEDANNAQGAEDDDADTPTSYNRINVLNELITELGASAHAEVYSSVYTLEADLLEPTASNAAALRAAFIKQKPRSGAKFDGWVTSDESAKSFYAQLCKNKGYLAKGEFAHDLALELKDAAGFVCPNYIARALHQVTS